VQPGRRPGFISGRSEGRADGGEKPIPLGDQREEYWSGGGWPQKAQRGESAVGAVRGVHRRRGAEDREPPRRRFDPKRFLLLGRSSPKTSCLGPEPSLPRRSPLNLRGVYGRHLEPGPRPAPFAPFVAILRTDRPEQVGRKRRKGLNPRSGTCVASLDAAGLKAGNRRSGGSRRSVSDRGGLRAGGPRRHGSEPSGPLVIAPQKSNVCVSRKIRGSGYWKTTGTPADDNPACGMRRSSLRRLRMFSETPQRMRRPGSMVV